MKKLTSIFALLLLGGLVLTGCSNSEPGGAGNLANNPSDNGSSGSGNNGSGSGNGSQGSGEGSGSGSGGQSGEGGSGSNEGTGEIPGDSQFVNKKFVVSSIVASDATVQAQMQAAYQNGYAALFDDGTVELISIQNSLTYAMLGTFTVAEDDSYAVVKLIKQYDGESEGYYWISGAGFTTNIRYNANLQEYVMPMQYTQSNMTFNFDVHMTVSADYPQKANIPTDPNGNSYSPTYQVYKSSYDEMIIDRGLLYHYPNFTVSHTYTNALNVQETETFEAENYNYKITYSTAPNLEIYYERTTDTLTNGMHTYTYYEVNNGVLYGTTPSFEFFADHWDEDIGLVPIPFNNLRYSEETHCYYAGSFTWASMNDPNTSITVTAIKIYFNNYKLVKVQFKDFMQNQYEYNFTKHNQTDVTLPSGNGSSGGQGSGQQGGGGEGGEQTAQPSDYYRYIENKSLVFDRATNSGDLSSEELALASEANSNLRVGVFEDHSIELEWPTHFYMGGQKQAMHIIMYGSISFTGFTTLGSNEVVRATITIANVYVDGENEGSFSFMAHWYINAGQLRLQMDDTNGDRYYVYLNVTNTAPTHIPTPQSSQGQGGEGGQGQQGGEGGGSQTAPIYPSSKITTYLAGTDDETISFENEHAESYQTYDPEGMIVSLALIVGYESSYDTTGLVNGYIEQLETKGYGEKYSVEDNAYVYVSPDREIGYEILMYASTLYVYIYNFVANPTTFEVEYTLVFDDNWDLYSDDAQLYVWIWGGTYGTGEFVEITKTTNSNGEEVLKLYDIDDAAEGMNVVRFADGSDIAWSGAGVHIHSQSDNIDLTGNNLIIHFSVHDY